MQRVSVVGTSGSGKSTIARAIAERLEVPHVELDSIYWQPAWTPLSKDEFRRRVSGVVAGDEWVVDGNYREVQPLVWERAEGVLWLDYSSRLVMWRIVRRSIVRVLRRTTLWNGNRERIGSLVARDPERSVIRWAWTSHQRTHDRYQAAKDDPANAHLWFVQARSPKEAEAYVHSLVPASVRRREDPSAPYR